MFRLPFKRRNLPVALTLLTTFLLLGLLQAGLVSAAVDPGLTPGSGDPAADIVVDFGNGHSVVNRVTFSDTISGLDALMSTGLDVDVYDAGWGIAICAIEGVGCPVDDCFCNASKYWGYQYWQDDAWQGYLVGAADSLLTDGAIDGWIWGEWGDAPPAVSPEILAAQAGLQWLRSSQQADGSFPGFGGNAGATLDVILAIAAANQNPAGWASAQNQTPLDAIYRDGPAFAEISAASAGKLALGLAAADLDPRRFGSLDLLDTLGGYYDPAAGVFGASVSDQALAMLGWQAAGATIPTTATQTLAGWINDDGGWGWLVNIGSDADTTSLVLQALVAGGEPLTSTAVISGLAYLDQAQNDDGGFPNAWEGDSNTNSSAFAIQGLLAAGQDPLGPTWTISGTTAIDFLLGQQMADGGFAFIDPPADAFATRQTPPALAGKPFPYPSRQVALRKALEWIASEQQDDGGFGGFGVGDTVDALLAIVAAGGDPAAFVSGTGNTPLDYLAANAAGYAAAGASAAGKLALGVVAAGEDPASFGGVDLVAQINNTYVDGRYGGPAGSTWDQSFAILGLVAAGETVPVSATQTLADLQADGGGWNFSANDTSAAVDSTGLALQALAAAGVSRDDPAVAAGLAFLHTAQLPTGGFPGWSGDVDASSTGFALQALAAYNENPRDLSWTRTTSDGTASSLTLHTPVDAALGLQSPAGGFAGWSGPNDPFSTHQIAPGLAGKAFPLAPPKTYHFPAIQRAGY